MKINDESPVLLALLDAAVDAMVVADHAGNILRVNKAAAMLFGHSVDVLVGQNVRMLMPHAMAVLTILRCFVTARAMMSPPQASRFLPTMRIKKMATILARMIA